MCVMVHRYLKKVEWPLLPAVQGNQLRDDDVDGPLCLFNNVLVLRSTS